MPFFVAMSSPCASAPNPHARTLADRLALLRVRPARKCTRASLVIHKSGTWAHAGTPKGGDPPHLDREPSCGEPEAGLGWPFTSGGGFGGASPPRPTRRSARGHRRAKQRCAAPSRHVVLGACAAERAGQPALPAGQSPEKSCTARVRKREPATHNAVDTQTSVCIIRLRRNGK